MSQEEHNSVVVVGSTMIDLISYSSRVPQAGETIVGDSFQMTFGGKGANQAVMASILGSQVGFINCLGKDVYGDSYRENLEKYDIDLTYLSEGESPTGVATILVEPDGTNRIVIVPGANFELTPKAAREGVLNFAPRVVVGQLEVSIDATLEAFLAAKEIGATTILNPAPATGITALPDGLLETTDWLIPNENEFQALSNEVVSESSIFSFVSGKKFSLIVTLGEEGVIFADQDRGLVTYPASKVDAIDTTGAGDAFVGAFAHGLDQGLDPGAAIMLGLDRATDSVTRKGTQISYMAKND
ncbi:MAG: ribokinase [Actinobacteria bacterium]|nr:ribokinase [Actinomycetota bacterium]